MSDSSQNVPRAVTGALVATGLVFTSDRELGYRRRGHSPPFRYVDERGRPVRDAKQRARIDAVVLPPAWTDVWICANPRGHLQATGRDARGRKQYRYHAKWRAEHGSFGLTTLRNRHVDVQGEDRAQAA